MAYMDRLRFITQTDMFCEMPVEAQVLFFHMVAHATGNDQSYNTRSLMRALGCGEDSLNLLIKKGFIEEGYCNEGEKPQFYDINYLSAFRVDWSGEEY